MKREFEVSQESEKSKKHFQITLLGAFWMMSVGLLLSSFIPDPKDKMTMILLGWPQVVLGFLCVGMGAYLLSKCRLEEVPIENKKGAEAP